MKSAGSAGHGVLGTRPGISPLVAFFAGRRPDRVQLVFLALFVIGAIHLSFFSLHQRNPTEARAWLLSTWIPMLLPIWLVDGEMNRRGAVRLFVWPRSGLAPIAAAYILARSMRAIALTVVLALLSINTELAGEYLPEVVACALLGLFVSAFVAFWNVIAGARTVYPAVYAAAFILFWVYSRMAENRILLETAQWLLIPIWVLDPVSASQLMGEPVRVLQACSATAVWYAATWFVLHRSYR